MRAVLRLRGSAGYDTLITRSSDNTRRFSDLTILTTSTGGRYRGMLFCLATMLALLKGVLATHAIPEDNKGGSNFTPEA